MSKGKILFVVTSDGRKLGTDGNTTGWYLPEVAHPYDVLTKEGYEIDYVSPKGGEAPMDVGSGKMFKDDICQAFLKDEVQVSKLKNTHTAAQINAADYKALFYAGGHGPMFDLPGALDIAELAAKIYKQGGVLSAVCHGTVGFVPVKIDGKSLVDKQTVTCFTDAEEDAVGLSKDMPFMLETELKKLGAIFKGEKNWECNVQVSGKLITGQNPASAKQVGKEMVKLLAKEAV